MCKFTYLLKFICVPKSIPTVSLQSFADLCTCGTVKTLSLQEHMFAAEAEQGDALFSCFSSHIVTKCPFCGQINAQIKYHIFCPPPAFFFCFLLAILLFKMVPKCRAQVLSRVPKCKKTVMSLKEKYI